MSDLQNRIKQLKREKNAVILAHYYVHDEVQEIADYIGDSFYLSKVATKTDADTIVFCGVSFLCENHTIIEKILPYNLWNFILFFLKNLKCNLFLIHSSRNGIAFFHFSVQDGFCERILNFALDRAF